MTTIRHCNDSLHCSGHHNNIKFVPVGVWIYFNAGGIKADNSACKKAQRLLYRGTGNRRFLFINYIRLISKANQLQKNKANSLKPALHTTSAVLVPFITFILHRSR
jgi:hypothetical protein